MAIDMILGAGQKRTYDLLKSLGPISEREFLLAASRSGGHNGARELRALRARGIVLDRPDGTIVAASNGVAPIASQTWGGGLGRRIPPGRMSAEWRCLYDAQVSFFRILRERGVAEVSLTEARNFVPETEAHLNRIALALIERGICAGHLQGQYTLRTGKSKELQALLMNEKAFCAIGGIDCPCATEMDWLLRYRLDPTMDYATAVVYMVHTTTVMGSALVVRRTGIPARIVNSLQIVSRLPPAVRDVAVQQCTTAYDTLLKVQRLTSEEEMIAILRPSEPDEDEVAEALSAVLSDSNEDNDEGVAEEGPSEVAVTTLRLVAGIADVIADLAAKVDFLAAELGYGKKERS